MKAASKANWVDPYLERVLEKKNAALELHKEWSDSQIARMSRKIELIKRAKADDATLEDLAAVCRIFGFGGFGPSVWSAPEF